MPPGLAAALSEARVSFQLPGRRAQGLGDGFTECSELRGAKKFARTVLTEINPNVRVDGIMWEVLHINADFKNWIILVTQFILGD